eukprot:8913804-Pyramimonas_sp.AAC.1
MDMRASLAVRTRARSRSGDVRGSWDNFRAGFSVPPSGEEGAICRERRVLQAHHRHPAVYLQVVCAGDGGGGGARHVPPPLPQ